MDPKYATHYFRLEARENYHSDLDSRLDQNIKNKMSSHHNTVDLSLYLLLFKKDVDTEPMTVEAMMAICQKFIKSHHGLS